MLLKDIVHIPPESTMLVEGIPVGGVQGLALVEMSSGISLPVGVRVMPILVKVAKTCFVLQNLGERTVQIPAKLPVATLSQVSGVMDSQGE
jgi:predicted ATP-dependent protease